MLVSMIENMIVEMIVNMIVDFFSTAIFASNCKGFKDFRKL